jgi:hypothetical protein
LSIKKNLFYLFVALSFLTLASCDKDSHKRVKYRVVSKSSVNIFYTMNGRMFDITREAGDWSVSYRGKIGSDFLISTYKTDFLFDVTASVYIDGELFESASTKDMLDLVILKGQVPE